MFCGHCTCTMATVHVLWPCTIAICYIRGRGGKLRQLSPTGKLFCLACLHARTHTAELTGRASQKNHRVSARLSPLPRVTRVFAVFVRLWCCFLMHVSRISPSWLIWTALGCSLHVFSQGIWIWNVIFAVFLCFYDELRSARVFSCVFDACYIDSC